MRIDISRTRTRLALAGLGAALVVIAALAASQVVLDTAHAAEAQRWGGPGGRGGPGGWRGPGGRGGPGGWRGPGGRGAWLAGPFGSDRAAAFLPSLRRLDLSDEQRERVRTVIGESRESARTTAREMRSARAELAEAATADGVDEAEIRSRAARVGTLEGDAAVQRARLYAAVRQVLTPDQRARVDEIEAERQERLGERRERMQERRESRQERRRRPDR